MTFAPDTPPNIADASAPPHEPAGAPSHKGTSGGRIRLLARFALVVYVVWLAAGDLASWATPLQPAVPPAWGRVALDPDAMLRRIAFAGTMQSLRFGLLGVLAGLAVGGGAETRRGWRLPLIVLLCVTLSYLLLSTQLGAPAGPAFASLAFGVSLAGAWIGASLMRGRRAVLWMVPKLAALAVAVTVAVAYGAWLLTSTAPLPFEPAEVTPTEKRRLVRHLQDSEQLPGDYQRLALTEDDINRLATTFFDAAPIDGKARVALDDGRVALRLSIRIPFRAFRGRWLNLHGGHRVRFEKGRLSLEPEDQTIGSLSLPGFLLAPPAREIIARVLREPSAGEIVESVDRVQLAPERVTVVFRAGSLRDRLRDAIGSILGEPADVVEATRFYYGRLVDSPAIGRDGDAAFLAHLQYVFRAARRRTASGGDPVLENRAAILALAILFGHYRVERLVGDVRSSRDDDTMKIGRVTLRGRKDWSRHFFVSAALAVLSNQVVSDAAGLFKEELDAGEGGSGFSFADLLADRAGVEFAIAATHSADSARRVQEILAREIAIDDLFPAAGDLPEGISDEALRERYGGIGGAGYRKMIAEIERRLETCSALQTDSETTP